MTRLKSIALASVSLASVLLLLSGKAEASFSNFSLDAPGTTAGQILIWSITANNGFGGWVPTSSLLSNGTEWGLGGAATTTDMLSIYGSGSLNGETITMASGATGSALKLSAPIGTKSVQFVTATNSYPTGDMTEKVGIGVNSNDLWIEGMNRIVLNPVYSVDHEQANDEYLAGISWFMYNFSFYINGCTNYTFQTNHNNTNVLTMGYAQDTILTPYDTTKGVVILEQSGQTRNPLEIQSSTKAILANITAAGAINSTVPFQQSGVAGYSGTIPTTAQSLHVVGGIIEGYTNSSGTLIGN